MRPCSIVLCGGKERRFGRSKAMARVGGLTIMERILNVLGPISEKVVVVTSQEKKDMHVGDRGTVVVDAYPGKGPLGGIYTGLLHSETPLAIVVGCDMPFLNTEFLLRMCEIAEGFDVVVPRLGGDMFEPLHAVYAKTCLSVMKTALESDQLAISPVFKQLRVRYMQKEEYLPLDPRMLSFFNVNYPEDLDRAIRIAEQNEGVGAPSSPSPSEVSNER